MKKQFLFSLFAMLIAAISFTSCSNDDDVTAEPENEEEEITRVEVSLTKAGGPAETYVYNVDGTKQTITLDPNTVYTATVGFFNEDEVVTTEIKEESDEHLICFSPSNSNVVITRTDKDSNNKEIGLESSWAVGAAGDGTLNITLKHQPDLKANQATENCSIGGTDVDVTFDVKVQ